MKKILSILMIAALGVFLVAGSASALSLRLTQGATVVTIDDGGANDVNSAVGALTFVGSVGIFTINVSTGLSKPVIPNTPASLGMDLSSVNLSNSAGTLLLELTDIGFGLAIPPSGMFGFVTNIGGTIGTGSSLDFYNAYMDPLDAAFAQTNLIASLGPFTSSPFSGSTSGTVPAANPFSLTQVVQLTHGAGMGITSSFDADLIPEPGNLLLIGAGLIGLAGLVRRELLKK